MFRLTLRLGENILKNSSGTGTSGPQRERKKNHFLAGISTGA
jgi:hypothetical protein